MNYRERLKNKKRIVIKIGSSSLTHPETGRLNLRKLEVLARELCDLRNQGKTWCWFPQVPSQQVLQHLE